jgi:DNA-binding transcriptional MocR family regulator
MPVNQRVDQADLRKYVQLAAAIRGRILDGSLRPGESVPSISILSAEHRWARQTCSKALQMLEAEGLVLRVRGIGYFVNSQVATPTGSACQPPILRVADLLHSRRDGELGRSTGMSVLAVERRAAELSGGDSPGLRGDLKDSDCEASPLAGLLARA